MRVFVRARPMNNKRSWMPKIKLVSDTYSRGDKFFLSFYFCVFRSLKQRDRFHTDTASVQRTYEKLFQNEMKLSEISTDWEKEKTR